MSSRVSPLMAVRSPAAVVHAFADLLLTGNGRWARAFENLILGLIVLSVASVGIEVIPGLPSWAEKALYIGEIVVIAVFTLEYLLRLVAAEKRMQFVLSFQGLVDLLSIAPFYLVGLDARWLRALRMLRLVRLLKLQTHILEKAVAQRTHELAEKNAALELAQAQIKAELNVARALQLAILPAKFPAKVGLRRRRPHDSGDFHGRRFLRLHGASRRADWVGDG